MDTTEFIIRAARARHDALVIMSDDHKSYPWCDCFDTVSQQYANGDLINAVATDNVNAQSR